MSQYRPVAGSLARHFRQSCLIQTRPFTANVARHNATTTTTTTTSPDAPEAADAAIAASVVVPPPSEPTNPLDQNPDTVSPEFEAFLMRQGKMPVGSRRRRVALRSVETEIPFEQLPYQAFQEARKVLAADREQKLTEIAKEAARIKLLQQRDYKEFKGGKAAKDRKLSSMRKYLAELKILADVNDPVIKKRFEDGLGDMNKPIYRYYAERRWRSYDQKLIAQRIAQFNIVPDILPKFEPTADVELYFQNRRVSPGETINSLTSERPPRLRVQVFDKGERLVTVVVLDADVPNLETDTFDKRCHFMAANIPLSPTQTSLPLHYLTADKRAVDWIPPTSQKGAPYHRLAVFLLEQQPGRPPLNVAELKALYAQQASESEGKSESKSFSLKSFRDKFKLSPFGFSMFRSEWDENTAEVMARHGVKGAELELHQKRVYSIKPVAKPRGWEAKRQGPKFRHLWKYTKRIRGVSNARGLTKRR